MISRRQLWALVALTLMWGVNWPMMKLSLRELSPLYFRALTMTCGALGLYIFYRTRGLRMWPQGGEWRSVIVLGLPNMLGWHTVSILGVQQLASGRAAILGFTMPIWTWATSSGPGAIATFTATMLNKSRCSSAERLWPTQPCTSNVGPRRSLSTNLTTSR